jgi:HK97 family phage portal protein
MIRQAGDWLRRVVSAATGWAPTDDRWYGSSWAGTPTQSGVAIDEDIAMSYAAVFMVVSKYAKTMATLPVQVLDRVSDLERQPVDHILNDLFTVEAAPDVTGLTLREMLQANAMLWGNGYAEKVLSNDRSELRQLIPLMSRDVTPMRADDGSLVFAHRPPGGPSRILPADRVFRVPGLSLNGMTGLSVIGYTREALGLGMAATEMAGSYYGNSAFMGGFVQRDPDKEVGKLSRDGGEQLIADLERKFKGANKAFGIGLLREGMKYSPVQIPLVDAELLASREASVIDVCGIFDIPPSKVHRLKDGGKWNNMEEQDTAWAKDSLRPWCVRFETAVRSQLLPRDSSLYFRHNLAGVMRGAFKSQNESFAIGRQWGWFSINDIRSYLELNPIEGGNTYLEPMNMVPVGEPRIQTTPPRKGDDGEKGSEFLMSQDALSAGASSGACGTALLCDLADKQVATFAPLARDIASRVAGREIKEVTAALARLEKTGKTKNFAAWLDKFYTQHVEYIEQCLRPLAEAFKAATGRDLQSLPADVAGAYAESNHDTLMAIAEDPARMSGVLDTWKKTKADALAAGIVRLLEESMKSESPTPTNKE